MIKIDRSSTTTPPTLQKPSNTIVKGDYSKDDVKRALIQMQNNKCCYCERIFYSMGDSENEIDHYFPRGNFKKPNGDTDWGRANAWDNLLYACGQCNGAKSRNQPVDPTTGEILILNPCDNSNDPEDHISFEIESDVFDSKCIPNNGSPKGNNTIENLKLNKRVELRTSRMRAMWSIDVVLHKLVEAIANGNMFAINRSMVDLREEASADQEHANLRRRYIDKMLGQFRSKFNNMKGGHQLPLSCLNINIPKGSDIV